MSPFLALAVLALGAHGAINSRSERIESVPLLRYKSDCGKPANLKIKKGMASLLQKNPGAGLGKIEPFEKVEKDGFMQVTCVKDYMYYFGDKFGDNRYDYKIGDVSNVSIVLYEKFIEKIDRKPMTQKVCFEFCRTVPDMLFFGVVNGRDCYCAPYFQQMESDSSSCDAVCEGDTALMCGGKSKSSIFSMHMCDSTEDDLGAAMGAATSLKSDMDGKVTLSKGLGDDMQADATALQKTFGKVGDSGASGLMQKAKVFAGDLTHKAEDVEALATKLEGIDTDGKKISDFSDPAEITKAERLMEKAQRLLGESEAKTAELDALIALASPQKEGEASKEYYPLMYFVDKKFEDMPSTCAGKAVDEPIVGEDLNGCAAACNAQVHDCVGFSYFGTEKKLCFLLSEIETATYYTGCGSSFLQQAKSKSAPFQAGCYAKLSKFQGTNPKKGMKELTKADRCFE